VLGAYAGDLHRRAIVDLDWATVSRVRVAPGVGIPTLEDVLHSMPASGTAYVEIKAIAIEHLVEAALRRADRRCAVHSFDFGIIGRMRDIAPATPRGILLDRAAKDIETLIKAVGARDVWPEWSLIDRALVDRVHRAGGRVIAWTVNSRRDAEQLIAMGVDGLCTDDIRLLDGL
jgi:glycerophosphoryl diester phosphodiesterase